jgi:hypothetical protein
MLMLILRDCGRTRTNSILLVSNHAPVLQSVSPIVLLFGRPNFNGTSLLPPWKQDFGPVNGYVLPLRDLLIALSPSIGVHDNHDTSFKTTLHEDNAGALTLANLEPGRITPRSKHYAVKLHWFRSKLDPGGKHPITIVKIDTAMQRADILKKV